MEKERDFWHKNVLNKFINVPNKYPFCKKGLMKIINNNSLNNPLIAKCNSYKCCRTKYLRVGTIFEINYKTPVSVLYTIIKLWLIEEKNVSKIEKTLKDIYKVEKVDNRFIYIFIHNLRTIIANYIKSKYILEPLAEKEAFQHIIVDESLFSHLGGMQQWVVQILNNETKGLRLEIVNERNTDTLRTIITNHVLKGNYIITDCWRGYNFLSAVGSGYIDMSFNHSRGIYGFDINSTCRIETVWAELKQLIKKIYGTIKEKNFVYFLKESEFRKLIKNLNPEEILNELTTAVSCVLCEGHFESLLNEDDLISIDYLTQFEN